MKQHVGAFEHARQDLAALGALEVGDDAAFVRIEVDEQAALLGVGLTLRKGSAPARYVAPGRLDLDDIRAEVGEHLGSESRRHALAAFNNLDRIER
jgi:hypothetical protein